MSTHTATPPPDIEDTADHTDDVTAIRRLVADVEEGFNAKDAELSVAHFAANASVVNVAGVHVTGHRALLELHRDAYAGPLRDQYARYDLADVTFLRPDVAVAHKLARAVTADGDPVGAGHAMIALYVLVKEDGRWWVAARQNTSVPAGPAHG